MKSSGTPEYKANTKPLSQSFFDRLVANYTSPDWTPPKAKPSWFRSFLSSYECSNELYQQGLLRLQSANACCQHRRYFHLAKTKLAEIKRICSSDGLQISNHQVLTKDNASLDTVTIIPNSCKRLTHVAELKAVVHCLGNGMNYHDELPSAINDAKICNQIITLFNYRGVGNSSPAPNNVNDLITDVTTQIKRLLSLGIPADNITVCGQSLGGGLATQAAYNCHQAGHKVKCFNIRSFSELAKVPKIALEDSQSSGGSILGCLAGSALHNLGWHLSPADAYRRIPSPYRDYMYSTGDGVIPQKASLHFALGNRVLAQQGWCISGTHNTNLNNSYHQGYTGHDIRRAFFMLPSQRVAPQQQRSVMQRLLAHVRYKAMKLGIGVTRTQPQVGPK